MSNVVDDGTLAMFCDITGADESTAAHYLSASGGDVEVAVGLFMDSGNGKAGPSNSAAAAAIVEDEIRQPIRATRGVLIDDGYGMGDTSHWVDPARSAGGLFSRMGAAPFASFADSADLSTERGRRLAELFKIPSRIIFVGTFDGARQLAKSQGRWLVVSLHDGSEFQCQMLNRDLWNNGDVQDFVLEHLVYMQLNVGTGEADRFMRFYPFTGHPHVSLIDPRTGKLVKTWARIPAPAEFIGEMIDFAESHPLKAATKTVVIESESEIESDGASEVDSDLEVQSDQDNTEMEMDVNEPSAAQAASSFDSTKDLVEEPSASNPGVTTLQFRLPDGSKCRRRFLTCHLVEDLFVYIKSLLPTGNFDILEHTKSLKEHLSSSLEQLSLKNASLNVVLI